jgi:hypothetical protein
MDLGTPTKQKLGCKTGSRHLGIILGKIEIDEVVEDKCGGWGLYGPKMQNFILKKSRLTVNENCDKS